MLPRIEQHKVRGLPFRVVRSHIADQIRSRHCRDIARITHRVASATERSQCLDCQDEDRQQLPCSHKISSWKTMPPDSRSQRADETGRSSQPDRPEHYFAAVMISGFAIESQYFRIATLSLPSLGKARRSRCTLANHHLWRTRDCPKSPLRRGDDDIHSGISLHGVGRRSAANSVP